MTQLVVFDLDGTLLDTLADLAAATNYALAKHNLPPRSLGEVRAFVGNGIPVLARRAVPAGTPAALEAAVLETLLQYYGAHCREHTCPYPGIPALLETLKERGVQTAVVTNKAESPARALCGAIFPGAFSLVAGGRPDLKKKPAPDAVNAALAALGVSKENAVYVGDSEVDVQTAANAGLPFIGVVWGFRSREQLRAAGCGVFADSAAGLEALLLKNG